MKTAEQLGAEKDERDSEMYRMLERARVVGVLDAWAEAHPGHAFKTDIYANDCNTDEPWLCGPSPRTTKLDRLARRGETPDAARAAAAKAIEAGEV